MRDGTILRADIYRPSAPGRYPVLLQGTPYNKHREGSVDLGRKGVARGYIVINQDVRGRYTARETKYFLHSAGKANSAAGDGTLSATPPRSEQADQYNYDPANPVPTVGGPLCCDSSHLAPGPKDQRTAETRQDVLLYSTPVLSLDTEVTGNVQLELFAKSSLADTDFTAKLVDVAPEGFAQNLTEGIVCARYRNSQEKPELMKPGARSISSKLIYGAHQTYFAKKIASVWRSVAVISPVLIAILVA